MDIKIFRATGSQSEPHSIFIFAFDFSQEWATIIVPRAETHRFYRSSCSPSDLKDCEDGNEVTTLCGPIVFHIST
jgi:hypothetical protein